LNRFYVISFQPPVKSIMS